MESPKILRCFDGDDLLFWVFNHLLLTFYEFVTNVALNRLLLARASQQLNSEVSSFIPPLISLKSIQSSSNQLKDILFHYMPIAHSHRFHLLDSTMANSGAAHRASSNHGKHIFQNSPLEKGLACSACKFACSLSTVAPDITLVTLSRVAAVRF